jgi:hypothetical protein
LFLQAPEQIFHFSSFLVPVPNTWSGDSGQTMFGLARFGKNQESSFPGPNVHGSRMMTAEAIQESSSDGTEDQEEPQFCTVKEKTTC